MATNFELNNLYLQKEEEDILGDMTREMELFWERFKKEFESYLHLPHLLNKDQQEITTYLFRLLHLLLLTRTKAKPFSLLS